MICDTPRATNGCAKCTAASHGAVEIGISQHAQSALGDLVFVEVPEAGREV
jgi:glycine cleavage system H lipoate-binding protein